MPRTSIQPSPKNDDVQNGDTGDLNQDRTSTPPFSAHDKPQRTSWLDRVQRITGVKTELLLPESSVIADGGRRLGSSIKPGWYMLQVDIKTLADADSAFGHTLKLSMGTSIFELLLASMPVARRVIRLTDAISHIDVRLEDGLDPENCITISLSRVSKRYAERRMVKRMTRRYDPTLYKESISNVERLRTDMLRHKGHWPTTGDLFKLYHQAVQRNFTPTPYQLWLNDHQKALNGYWTPAPMVAPASEYSARILLQSQQDVQIWQGCAQHFSQTANGFCIDQSIAMLETYEPDQQTDYLIIAGANVHPAKEFLTAIATTLQRHPGRKLLFTDNDNINDAGELWHPVVKPGWDPYLLEAGNYIGPLIVCSVELYEQCGGLNHNLNDAAFYDFLLTARQYLTRNDVSHIPGILYSQARRSAMATTDRWFFKCEGDGDSQARHLNHPQPDSPPSVDIIIPSRNQTALLRQCVESILSLTDYPDFHITVIDNGSNETSVFDFYESLAEDNRFSVLNYPGPFNYSAINNSAVAKTRGDILVLLNNDTQVIEPAWLSNMVSACVREKIGCVGAKLLYGNGRVQHAGVVMGMKGIAGHAHRFCKPESRSYMHKLQVPHQVSAVTAACLAVRRDLFEELGGLDEKSLTVAFNDVDFCLRVHAAGYDNLLLSDVTLIHHESVSRGKDDSPVKAARFAAECKIMRERWPDMMHRDPYWNPLLSLVDEQPMLEAALPPVA